MFLMLSIIFCTFTSVFACNQALCGSVVTKCLLTESCKCDLNNKECSKNCINCLNDLYIECCSCVDLCPNNTTPEELNKLSHVEEYSEVAPELFNLLTEYPDTLERWQTFTFPFNIDIGDYKPKQVVKIEMKSSDKEDLEEDNDNILTLNCTVAFWNDCISWSKCKNHCLSMGAQSYRWFHDGCCECVGQTCINYGINKSKCKNCGADSKTEQIDEDNDLNYDDYNYDDDLD